MPLTMAISIAARCAAALAVPPTIAPRIAPTMVPMGAPMGALSAAPPPAALEAAGTHLSAWLAVPVAAVAGLVLGGLWWHVGRPGVPRSRRLVRRASLALALVLVPLLVAGTSFVDAGLEPRRYAEIWTAALGVLGAIVASAALDAANSVRLHRREAQRERLEAAHALREAVARARTERSDQPTTPRRVDQGP